MKRKTIQLNSSFFRDKRKIHQAGNFLSFRIEPLRTLIHDTIGYAFRLCDRNRQNRGKRSQQGLLLRKDMRKFRSFLVINGVHLLETVGKNDRYYTLDQ